jgi:hypothetical protein
MAAEAAVTRYGRFRLVKPSVSATANTGSTGTTDIAAPKIHRRLILMAAPQKSFWKMFYELMFTDPASP